VCTNERRGDANRGEEFGKSRGQQLEFFRIVPDANYSSLVHMQDFVVIS